MMAIVSWMGIGWALIELRAMQKSTHSLQYVDMPEPTGVKQDESGFETLTDKQREEIADEDDLFGDETIHTNLQ